MPGMPVLRGSGGPWRRGRRPCRPMRCEHRREGTASPRRKGDPAPQESMQKGPAHHAVAQGWGAGKLRPASVVGEGRTARSPLSARPVPHGSDLLTVPVMLGSSILVPRGPCLQVPLRDPCLSFTVSSTGRLRSFVADCPEPSLVQNQTNTAARQTTLLFSLRSNTTTTDIAHEEDVRQPPLHPVRGSPRPARWRQT